MKLELRKEFWTVPSLITYWLHLFNDILVIAGANSCFSLAHLLGIKFGKWDVMCVSYICLNGFIVFHLVFAWHDNQQIHDNVCVERSVWDGRWSLANSELLVDRWSMRQVCKVFQCKFCTLGINWGEYWYCFAWKFLWMNLIIIISLCLFTLCDIIYSTSQPEILLVICRTYNDRLKINNVQEKFRSKVYILHLKSNKPSQILHNHIFVWKY